MPPPLHNRSAPRHASRSNQSNPQGGNDSLSDNTTLVGVTQLLGPGPVSFGIDCDQIPPGAIKYTWSKITAVAISAG